MPAVRVTSGAPEGVVARLQMAHPDIAVEVTAAEDLDAEAFVRAVSLRETLSSLMCEAASDGTVTWRSTSSAA